MAHFKPATVKPTVTADALHKLEIRVGSIDQVEDVRGSAKLIRLRVNFVDQYRTILAGLKAERADPRRLKGSRPCWWLTSSRGR